MNPTDTNSIARFFADLLLPLHYDNHRRGIKYLDSAEGGSSYWGGIASRTGGLAPVHAADIDAAALLDALGAYWLEKEDARMLLLLPHLKALHQSLAASVEPEIPRESAPQEFVYPLF